MGALTGRPRARRRKALMAEMGGEAERSLLAALIMEQRESGPI